MFVLTHSARPPLAAALAFIVFSSLAGAQNPEPGAPTPAGDTGGAKLGAPIEHPTVSAPCTECTAAKPEKRPTIPYPVLPKPSFWMIMPSGPGYYSVWDRLHDRCLEKPPQYGYPRFALNMHPTFNADFSYLDDPAKFEKADLLEKMHRLHLNDNWIFGTGGEFRYRHFNEMNARLTGKDNRYDLTRVRVFGDLQYGDAFRAYVEFIDAQTMNQDLVPGPADRNFGDLLNAFVDVKIPGFDDGAYVRLGRQQLLFGSQRLISPNDWANTMRTFDGVRAFKHSEKFDIDLFWMQPVIPAPRKFDSPDDQQNFYGLWTTYRPSKERTLDTYWLFLENNNRFDLKSKKPFFHGPLSVGESYHVHTLGFRYSGNAKNLLFDTEQMLQLGERQGQSIFAGASANGIGWKFADMPWNPVVWMYYDWASGSDDPTNGSLNTFNQLYAFGHYHFGWNDFVARQNIQDLNFHLYLYPTHWVVLDLQYHIFELARSRDALYNTAGIPLRFDPTGAAGRDVGQELDIICNFHLSRRQDILLAYAYLWEGRFIRETGPPTNNASTFWMVYNFRW